MILTGCASTAPTSKLPGNASYHRDKDLQNVWLADQFDFNGYDALYVAEVADQLSRTNNAEEAELMQWAKGDIRNEFVDRIGSKHVFRLVTQNKADTGPAQKTLILESTIVEYAKGNGAARFWAGEFGAGQPVLRLRGKITDGTNDLFYFESFRSGDSAAARLDPGWTPEKSLQSTDIHDLAVDMADYIEQISKHQSRK